MSWKKGTKARLIPFTEEEEKKIQKIADALRVSFVRAAKELINHSLKNVKG